MQTLIDPVKTIKGFLEEFQPEISKYRDNTISSRTKQSLFNSIPGYQLFDTDLNSLLDVYYSPLGLKSEPELPLGWKMPFHELALISHLSLMFKREILDRKYFISCLFRAGDSFIENPYPAMRFQLHMAQHLRVFGNNVMPKFLKPHEDFDMLVVPPTGEQVEIECKTQSDESGKRVDKTALEAMTEFLPEVERTVEKRIRIVVSCNESIREDDAKELINLIRTILINEKEPNFTHEINRKRFQISVKELGNVSESLSTGQTESLLGPFMKGAFRIGFIFKTPPPLMQGFSFVVLKSELNNRPLTNIVKQFREAENQFSGSKPSVLVLHHDADVDVEKISEVDNFRNALGYAFNKCPKVSSFVYSSKDNLNPSGFGYPFGRFAPFANFGAKCSIAEIKIPGLLAEFFPVSPLLSPQN